MSETWQEAFERNKHAVGRAVHEAWAAEKIRQGFADHARTIDENGVGCCLNENHHTDMLDYDDLAPNIQAYDIETGIVGFRMGYGAATARAEAAEQQAARLRAAAMLYLEGYELYFTTSGDDVPQKQMAEARRQMRAILEIEDQYPDRAALAASQPAPADEAHEYEGACRNVQHAANGACACTALVNGRLCRLSRINPIHQPDAPRGGQAEGEG